MDSTTLSRDDLLAAFKTLPQADQKFVLGELHYAPTTQRQRASVARAPAYSHLWAGVELAAVPAHLDHLMPVTAAASLPGFVAAMDGLAAFIARSSRRTLSTTEQTAVARLVVECLINDMRAWEKPLPISAKTIINGMARAPGAVERAFPGSAGAGLLAYVALMPS